MDGMDQAKHNLPHFNIHTKIDSSAWRLKTHVTGVLTNRHTAAYAFIDLCEWPHDSNLTVNVLLNTLLLIQNSTGHLPPVAYLQMDNCWRECKNKFVLAFLCILVEMRVFDKKHEWKFALGEQEMLCEDSKTLIPITFKFSPPKLSQLSVHSSSTSLQDKTLGSSSPGSGPLSEFLPAYSGKSCLKQQRKSSNTKSGSDDGIELQSLSDGQQLSDRPRQCVPRPSEKSKLPLAQEVEVLSPLTKSLWCANPPLKCRKRKKKELVLETLKQTKLSQVKELHKLNYNQRGKWMLCARNSSSLKGKSLAIEQLWKKVCSLIKEGHLPYCNAKLQETQGEVWVYCDFGHSLKVRSTLENALGNFGVLSFQVHPVGIVMEL